jgi:hypothetical protein
MTVQQILVEVEKFKPMTRETLYSHMRKLKIKPIGVRQCPQRYPEEAPQLVLQRLGLLPKKQKGKR